MQLDTFNSDTTLTSFALGLLGAYLAGSINFSILLFRILGKGDPRAYFSGNPGVTNVFRQSGWAMAAVVLLLDMGRAMAVAFLAGRFWSHGLVPWAGFGLILGNRYPCLHGFKGGKGVANFLGFYALLLPIGTLLGIALYGSVLGIVKLPFIASFGMLAVISGFGLAQWWPDPMAVSALVVTTAGIVWFHRGNIANLRKRP